MRSRLLATLVLAGLAATARGDAQIDAAIAALRSDSSLKVRAQAAIVLGQRNAREAVGALADAARNDSSEAVRLSAVSALARIGDPAGLGAVEKALEDEDERVREAARKAFAALSGPAGATPGSIAVLLEEASGKGDAALRAEFRSALERHLKDKGFILVARGQRYVLRPSVLKIDVENREGKTVVAVQASLVAVDGKGTMSAMLQGGARVKALGTASAQQLPKYQSKAMDVAAQTLSGDLKGKLAQAP